MHVCWEGCALCSFALGRYRFRAAYERMYVRMYELSKYKVVW